MATTYSGIIQFEDFKKKKSTVRVEGIADIAALGVFANTLFNRSRARVVGLTIAEHDSASIGTAQEGKFDGVDLKASFYLEDTVNSTNVSISVPAPLETLFEHQGRHDYIVTEAQGDALAQDMSTATGRTLRFVKGKLTKRNTQSQA